MKSRRALRVGIGALAIALLGGRPVSADSRSVEGAWAGSLQGALRIVLHVERTAAGFHATIDSPDQGAVGMSIDTLRFDGDSIHFELRGLRAGYAGRMNATGDSIAGEWAQSGFRLPLALARTTSPPGLRRPQEAHPPYPYDTLEVSFASPKAEGVRLAGTLTVPRGRGPFPSAVLITGSGPEDRDETVFGHRPFRVLADHLTRNGIAVLRADDRGVGRSTGTFSGATSEDFASDAVAGVEFLRGRKQIDPNKIGLIGHSEGGLIAPMVAARTRVAFLVLMAGPGIRGDSLLMLQSASMRRSIGVSEDALARESVVSRRMYLELRQNDSAAAAQAARELVTLQLAGISDEQRQAVGDPDSIAAGVLRQMMSPWMRFFVAYDPVPALRKLRMPVLAINGGKDQQVPARENLAAIRAALEAGGHKDFVVQELPDLNHLFQTSQTGAVFEYARIEETLAPAALDTITRWILDHVSAKR